MSNYFRHFPKVNYDLNKDGSTIKSVNLLKRFKIQDMVLNKSFIFFDYIVKEGERPDIIAFKIYKRADLDWLVLMSNSILDPYFEWPMSYYTFKRYIIQKYGSIENAHQTTHLYQRIIQKHEVKTSGQVIHERTLVVDIDAYNKLSSPERRTVSCYDYEYKLNEDRRRIKILGTQYISQIVKELERVFV